MHFFSLRVFFLPPTPLPALYLGVSHARKSLSSLEGSAPFASKPSLSSNSLVSLCGLSAGFLFICLKKSLSQVPRGRCQPYPASPVHHTGMSTPGQEVSFIYDFLCYSLPPGILDAYHYTIILQGQFIGLKQAKGGDRLVCVLFSTSR